MVLMDIMLPFFNGYHWCSAIRAISNVPVIFISSASDNMNIVMAMNMGGDDFIPKPVDPDVMMAKIQAVLRRTYDMAGRIPVLEHQGCAEPQRHHFDLSGQTSGADPQRIPHPPDPAGKQGQGRQPRSPHDQALADGLLCGGEHPHRQRHSSTQKLESIGLHQWIRTKVGSGYWIPAEGQA